MSEHPLAEYLDDLLRRNRMTMRAASLQAGLGEEAISQIKRNLPRSRPRVSTLQILATTLRGDVFTMMRLAGYDVPDLPTVSVPRLHELLDRLSVLPPDQQANVMDAFLVLLQVQVAVNEPT